jgi:hypothetical protein
VTKTGFFQSMAAALGRGNQNTLIDESLPQNNSNNNTVLSSNEDGSINIPEVDAVNDIFYVCRHAIYRVMGTKASAIASSCLIVINHNLMNDKLLADCRKNINENLNSLSTNRVTASANNQNNNINNSTSAADVSSLILALVWTGAVSAIAKGCKHLADEIARLSEKSFQDHQDDLLRFSEQRLDFVQTAATAEDILEQVCKSIGTEMYKLSGGVRGELKGMTFVMDPRSFFASTITNKKSETPPPTTTTTSATTSINDNNSPLVLTSSEGIVVDWIQPLTERFSAVLANVLLPTAPWPEYVRCCVVSSFMDAVAVDLEQALLLKRYDLSGALKLDQDLRQLRNFFASEEIDLDIPVREKFRRLTSICAVLLSERKSDAQSHVSNILSANDVNSLLKLRVDPPQN